MSSGNIPRPDNAAAEWMLNFATRLAASPETFHLSIEEADELQTAVDDFRAALAVATDPGTRTRPILQRKDSARALAESLCRRYYSLIKPRRDISDEQKVLLGVRPVNRQRVRRGAPTTAPQLYLTIGRGGHHKLRCIDRERCTHYAKPHGVAMLQLYCALGERPVKSPAEASLFNVYTNPGIRVCHPMHDRGKYATYFARWASPTGQPGPWSNAVGMRIVA